MKAREIERLFEMYLKKDFNFWKKVYTDNKFTLKPSEYGSFRYFQEG